MFNVISNLKLNYRPNIRYDYNKNVNMNESYIKGNVTTKALNNTESVSTLQLSCYLK